MNSKILEAARRSNRRRSSTLGKDILRKALGSSSSVDDDDHVNDLVSGISKLSVKNENTVLKLDIRLSDDHVSREITGAQAHELVKFWNRKDLDSVDILWGKEERGEEKKGIDFWRDKLLSSDRLSLAHNKHTRKVNDQSGLVKYLNSQLASRPWYEVQDLADRKVFPDHIDGADVLQGDLGDCYFACATSLCAEHYPDVIRSRIEKGSSGFKVFLWSQRRGSCNSKSPIMRRGPILTEISSLFFVHTRESRKGPASSPLYLRSRSQALYPMILEKAWVRRREKELSNPASYEDIANEMGFDAGDVIHVLTGLETDCVRVGGGVNIEKMTPSQKSREIDKLWNLISNALSQGRAVCGGTFAAGEGRHKRHSWKNQELLSHHNYCILDAGVDQVYGHFLILRNPQGS